MCNNDAFNLSYVTSNVDGNDVLYSLNTNPKNNEVFWRKSKHLCRLQKSRLSLFLGSMDHCNICIDRLSSSDKITMPLPHLAIPMTSIGNQPTVEGFATQLASAALCPYVMFSSDPKGTLEQYKKKLNLRCLFECDKMFRRPWINNPLNECRNGNCRFNDIDRIWSLVKAIYETAYSKARLADELKITPDNRCLLVTGTNSTDPDLDYINNIDNDSDRKWMFDHFFINGEKTGERLLVVSDTGCSSSAVAQEQLKALRESEDGTVQLMEVAGGEQYNTNSVNHLLTQIEDGTLKTSKINSMVLNKLMVNLPIWDTSYSIHLLVKEYEDSCEKMGMKSRLEGVKLPTTYGGPVSFLCGPKVVKIEPIFTSSFGMSLYSCPILLDGKQNFAIGGYLYDAKTPPKCPRMYSTQVLPIPEIKEYIPPLETTECQLNDNEAKVNYSMFLNTQTTSDNRWDKIEHKQLTFDSIDQMLLYCKLKIATREIDETGSCGYDSIKYLLDTQGVKVREHANDRFPI